MAVSDVVVYHQPRPTPEDAGAYVDVAGIVIADIEADKLNKEDFFLVRLFNTPGPDLTVRACEGDNGGQFSYTS
jgi:hypothetical protein